MQINVHDDITIKISEIVVSQKLIFLLPRSSNAVVQRSLRKWKMKMSQQLRPWTYPNLWHGSRNIIIVPDSNTYIYRVITKLLYHRQSPSFQNYLFSYFPPSISFNSGISLLLAIFHALFTKRFAKTYFQSVGMKS